MKKLLLALFLTLALTGTSFADTKSICKPKGDARSKECITILLSEVGKVLDRFYEQEFKVPNVNDIEIKYLNELESRSTRDITGMSALLGYAKDKTDTQPYRVFIFAPTEEFLLPKDMVIIHELLHIVVFHNEFFDNLSDSDNELLARDVAATLWYQLFIIQ